MDSLALYKVLTYLTVSPKNLLAFMNKIKTSSHFSSLDLCKRVDLSQSGGKCLGVKVRVCVRGGLSVCSTILCYRFYLRTNTETGTYLSIFINLTKMTKI